MKQLSLKESMLGSKAKATPSKDQEDTKMEDGWEDSDKEIKINDSDDEEVMENKTRAQSQSNSSISSQSNDPTSTSKGTSFLPAVKIHPPPVY